jgi:hypothetical protein
MPEELSEGRFYACRDLWPQLVGQSEGQSEDIVSVLLEVVIVNGPTI